MIDISKYPESLEGLVDDISQLILEECEMEFINDTSGRVIKALVNSGLDVSVDFSNKSLRIGSLVLYQSNTPAYKSMSTVTYNDIPN